MSLDREPRKVLITAWRTPPRTTAGLGKFSVALRTDGWERLVQNMTKLLISHTRMDSTHQNQVFMGEGGKGDNSHKQVSH